jgi:hypothetical protein
MVLKHLPPAENTSHRSDGQGMTMAEPVSLRKGTPARAEVLLTISMAA